MYHHALDLGGLVLPDFVRWKTTISLKGLGNMTPLVNIEPWFRTNSFNNFQRIRYEVGMRYKFNDRASFLIMYRREASLNLDPVINDNHYVINFTYNLP